MIKKKKKLCHSEHNTATVDVKVDLYIYIFLKGLHGFSTFFSVGVSLWVTDTEPLTHTCIGLLTCRQF